MRCRVFILACLLAFAQCVGVLAQDAADGRDKTVRDEMLKLLKEKQTPEFREKYDVEIPDAATNLPAKYDLLFYGQHVGLALLRIEVKVRGEEATMEMIDERGIFRGRVPLEPIDRLARQLAYAKIATTTLKPRDELSGEGMMSSHSPYRSFVISSRQRGSDFHLHSEANQLLGWAIREGSRGLAGYIETQGEKTLEQLADEHLKLVEPDAALRSELAARLKAVQMPGAGSQVHGLRRNLGATEAQLYGRLALKWRVAEAMDDLRRLNLPTLADQLAIATAEDPRELLAKALSSENSSLYRWSLQFVVTEKRPELVDLVIAALSKVAPYTVVDHCKELGRCELSPGQVERIAAFHHAAKDTRSRVAAAIVLVNRTDRGEYYNELYELATRKRGAAKYTDPEEAARDALFEYSVRSGKERDKSAKLARSVLDAIDPEANSDQQLGLMPAIRALAKLGSRQDVVRFKRQIRPKYSYPTNELIEAIAHFDPPTALPLARRQIQVYLDDPEGWNYGGFVASYLDLLVWQRDMNSGEMLRDALAKYRKLSPDETSWADKSELALAYLKASAVEERVCVAGKYVNAGGLRDDRWREAVAKELIAAGADAKSVATLLPSRDDKTGERD